MYNNLICTPTKTKPPCAVFESGVNQSCFVFSQHTFQKKTVVVVERCSPCGKRIKFGKSVLKCRDCAAVCHIECKHDVPMPCVANATRTPNAKLNGCYLVTFHFINSNGIWIKDFDISLPSYILDEYVSGWARNITLHFRCYERLTRSILCVMGLYRASKSPVIKCFQYPDGCPVL